MKRIALISIILLVLLSTSFSASAAPIYGHGPANKKATLMVQKWISSDDIVLGQSIKVHVNITNIANAYAYNPTISEPVFTPVTVKTKANYTKYNWVRLGKGASFSYTYQITPKVAGQFTVLPTVVDFFNANHTKITSQSSYAPFTVSKEAAPPETTTVWQTIFWYSFAFVMIPVVLFIGHKIVTR